MYLVSQYSPLIGQHWSRDLNTGLWLVDKDHVTSMLASNWSKGIMWHEYCVLIGWIIRSSSQILKQRGFSQKRPRLKLQTASILHRKGKLDLQLISVKPWHICPERYFRFKSGPSAGINEFQLFWPYVLGSVDKMKASDWSPKTGHVWFGEAQNLIS